MTAMSRVGEYYHRHIDAETPEQTVERIKRSVMS